MTTRPETVIDPVCGMTVNVAEADADGRIAEHGGRTYAFCRHGCRRAFLEDPAEFVAQAEAAAASVASGHDDAHDPGREHAAAPTPVIDEGMRRWYESCSCCLSDAYPDIKAALDAERAAAKAPPVDPGICEVAEAVEGVAAAAEAPPVAPVR